MREWMQMEAARRGMQRILKNVFSKVYFVCYNRFVCNIVYADLCLISGMEMKGK